MVIDIEYTRKYLRKFDFKTLFIEELGWEHCIKNLDIAVEGHNFSLSAIAEKRGMVAFTCSPLNDGRIPAYATRRKIERLTAKSVHEHIIIYADNDKTIQIWQWVKREAGKPTACREHTYHRNQPGDSLIQKLQDIAFSLKEEESLTIIDVTGRARAAFDIERVTKRFYDRFKTEHDAFLKFINGIPDEELQRWYASVMLNRLMFIYFVQKKGFLDNDTDYLRNKLLHGRQHGKDLFYKDLLCPLFFEGFAKKEFERSAKINKLLGDIPYLNGGLFLKHHIEELHGNKIQIADAAFEKLFDFFDQYQWHLDERPLKKDNEINPDVLGYIFEKYINQKQMGAYYTKEDITEYISKNTVIPYLFDAAKKKCKIAFEGESSVWKLLQSDPDRYIYDAVKSGVIDGEGNIIPESALPDFVQKGMHDPKARMFDRRYNLTEADLRDKDDKKLTLPTETWREYVERRNRCLENREKLKNGEIKDINDFITYNLNIRQFAQDVIENSEGPELLKAFYHAIEDVTVLDPTCGSGAFLFAALNILEPLYETCLDRMQVFLDELKRSGEKHRSDKYSDFRKILKRVAEHPNLKYFIFKSIIVKNLYGVDIMEEAIEICKLRLFLKLVAQIEKVENIEPLPDIDFNIRAGNTLVGFATYEEAKKAVTGRDQMAMQFDDTMERIKEQAEDVDHLFQLFHKQQTELGVEVAPEDKQVLKDKLKVLEDELNQYLAGEYSIDPIKKTAYEKWLKSHHPFHWFIEFYGILKNGGFDVIIGNPPYVEYRKVKGDYIIKGYQTGTCENLYAFVVERSIRLSLSKRTSLIIPLAAFGTSTSQVLRDFLSEQSGSLYVSYFSGDAHPSILFEGVKLRLSIFTTCPESNIAKGAKLHTTNYLRWYSEERNFVFKKIIYNAVPELFMTPTFPKLNKPIETQIISKIREKKEIIANFLENRPTPFCFYYHNAPVFFIRAMNFIPYYESATSSSPGSNHFKTLYAATSEMAYRLTGVLNSSTFYFWFTNYSANRDVTLFDIENFPLAFNQDHDNHAKFKLLVNQLMEDLHHNSVIREYNYKTGKVRYQEFYMRKSKTIIDKIDNILAKHYGFTDEELDFIINYDIKYRMGLNNQKED